MSWLGVCCQKFFNKLSGGRKLLEVLIDDFMIPMPWGYENPNFKRKQRQTIRWQKRRYFPNLYVVASCPTHHLFKVKLCNLSLRKPEEVSNKWHELRLRMTRASWGGRCRCEIPETVKVRRILTDVFPEVRRLIRHKWICFFLTVRVAKLETIFQQLFEE